VAIFSRAWPGSTVLVGFFSLPTAFRRSTRSVRPPAICVRGTKSRTTGDYGFHVLNVSQNRREKIVRRWICVWKRNTHTFLAIIIPPGRAQPPNAPSSTPSNTRKFLRKRAMARFRYRGRGEVHRSRRSPCFCRDRGRWKSTGSDFGCFESLRGRFLVHDSWLGRTGGWGRDRLWPWRFNLRWRRGWLRRVGMTGAGGVPERKHGV